MARWKPKEQFRQCFTDDMLRHLLVAVYDGCEAALRDVNATYGGIGDERRGPFESIHAFWMFGYARKAFVDLAVHNAAKSVGLFSRFDSNNNDSCPHTVVVSGAMILTPHFVHGSHELVRQAAYRTDYYSDPQGLLEFMFSEGEESDDHVLTPSLDPARYAFLIYGESSKPQYPAFVDIVFPIRNCTAYHGDRIQLCPMFSTFVADRVGPLSANTEAIPDQQLTLKSPPKEV